MSAWKDVIFWSWDTAGGKGVMSMAIICDVDGREAWCWRKARPRPDEAPVMRIVFDMVGRDLD